MAVWIDFVCEKCGGTDGEIGHGYLGRRGKTRAEDKEWEYYITCTQCSHEEKLPD